MYLLRLSMRPWRIALGSQVFTVAAMGFLLMLGGALQWLQASLGPVIQTLSREQVVTLYLEPSVAAGEEPGVVSQVQDALSDQIRLGGKVRYTGTAEFLAGLKTKYPQLSSEVESLGSDMAYVVPRSISVTAELDDVALERLRKVSGIESLEASRDRYLPVYNSLVVLQWVIRMLLVGLVLALLTGLVHLARMNAFLHRDAVDLLRLWGAGEGTVQVPSLMSGLGVGVLGGALAWLIWGTLGLWIAAQLRSLTPLLENAKVPNLAMGIGFVISGACLGVFSGLVGSRLSSGRTGSA